MLHIYAKHHCPREEPLHSPCIQDTKAIIVAEQGAEEEAARMAEANRLTI